MPKYIFFKPWGGYGDILLTTATLKKLREIYPEIRIFCQNRKKASEILKYNPCLDRFVPFPYHLFPKNGSIKATNNLDADPMIFYPSYGFLRPSLIVPQRHAINIIADMIGIEANHKDMSVDLSSAEIDYARRFKKDIGKQFIILQTTSDSPGRAWPYERWVEVVKFLKSCGNTTVQVGGSDDKAIPGVIDMLGKTTILQALALLSEAAFFLGVDSVFQHAAYALKLPAIVLFGSSSPTVWGYSRHINLYKKLPCQPCVDNPQPTVNRCMEQKCMLKISADEVISQVRNLL